MGNFKVGLLGGNLHPGINGWALSAWNKSDSIYLVIVNPMNRTTDQPEPIQWDQLTL